MWRLYLVARTGSLGGGIWGQEEQKVQRVCDRAKGLGMLRWKMADVTEQ